MLNGGEIRDTKTLNLMRNIVSLQVFVNVSRFSPCVIKSRAPVYFEQQILALLLVFRQTHNLSLNKFARALANQPISAPHIFNLQQMFLLRFKLIMQGEKQETSTKTLQRNNVAQQVEGFCISYFAALRDEQIFSVSYINVNIL